MNDREKQDAGFVMNRNEEYDIKLQKSPAPLYALGLTWLLYAVFFPLYLWMHYVILTLLSAAVYFIVGRIFPPKQIRVPKPYKAVRSGVSDVDKQIERAERNIQNIEAIGKAIASISPDLAEDTAQLTFNGRKILNYLAKNPEKATLLRRFLNYYLPTLEKLLESYIEFKSHETAAETRREIEETVKAMKAVFQKQLDKLLMDRELDISTDIDVLESMLTSDGLHEINNK